MSTIKETIASMFGKAKETGTLEQVSAQAVVNATEVNTAEPTEPEETPADSTPVEPASPAPAEPEAPAVSSSVVENPPAPAATMASIEVSALAEIQRKAAAYDGIHAEHAQLKAWHTAAQGGIGLGPDANMATEGKAKHVSAATRQAQRIQQELRA